MDRKDWEDRYFKSELGKLIRNDEWIREIIAKEPRDIQTREELKNLLDRLVSPHDLETRTLNLDGSLRTCSVSSVKAKTRFLEVVFRSVERLQVKVLLLPNNDITADCLVGALSRASHEESTSNLPPYVAKFAQEMNTFEKPMKIHKQILRDWRRDIYLFSWEYHSEGMVSLNKLDLSGNTRIGDRGVGSLVDKFFDSLCLNELLLSNTGMGDDGFTKIAQAMASANHCLWFLKKLDLSGNAGVKLSASVEVTYMPVKKLLLSNIGMTGKGLTKIAKAINSRHLISLRTLDLSGNVGIQGIGVVDLANSFISGNVMSKPIMKKLLLANIGMTGEGLTKIAEAFACDHLYSLKILDVSGNVGIQGIGVGDLANSFTSGKACMMKQLLLSNIGMTGEGLTKIVKAFDSGHLEWLETLDLSGNVGIQGIGVGDLANSFTSGKACMMKQLLLSNLGIEEVGARKIAQAISHLRSLEKLDLSRNRGIGDAGAEALAASFKSGKVGKMKELLLSDIGMGDKGAMEIAQAINSEHLHSLENLVLSDNGGIGDASVFALADSFRRDKVPSLRNVGLSRTSMSEEGLNRLLQALRNLN